MRCARLTATGVVAVKRSIGEPPAGNCLRPERIQDVMNAVNGTTVEYNTACGIAGRNMWGGEQDVFPEALAH